MKNKIRLRLLLYFAGSLLLFSLIIGLVFLTLFSRYNMNVHKAELENRAENIAESLSGYWLDSSGPMQGRGMGSQGFGYGAYLRVLEDVS